MKLVLLVLVCFATALSADAATLMTVENGVTEYRIPVTFAYAPEGFETPAKANPKDFMEKALYDVAQRASACLSDAMTSGASPTQKIKVTFQAQYREMFPSEKKMVNEGEGSGIFGEHYGGHEDGQLELGCSAPFTVYVAQVIKNSHAPFFGYEDLPGDSSHFKGASTLYLAGKRLENPEAAGKTLAHEMGHNWGGLQDRYIEIITTLQTDGTTGTWWAGPEYLLYGTLHTDSELKKKLEVAELKSLDYGAEPGFEVNLMNDKDCVLNQAQYEAVLNHIQCGWGETKKSYFERK